MIPAWVDSEMLKVFAVLLTIPIGWLGTDLLIDYVKQRRQREIDKKWGKPNDFWRKDG